MADDSNAYQQRLEHVLDHWEHFHRAQPFDEPGEAALFPLSGKGTVYSFTTATAPAEDFEPYAPYVLALVQLDEGPIVTAQLTDFDGPPAIGQRVEMVVRKVRTDGERGIIVYGPKFRPELRPSQG